MIEETFLEDFIAISKRVAEAEDPENFQELALIAGLNIKEDFAGDDLSGFDLSGVDLSYSNLRRTNLSGANLSNANLTYANLSNANLEDACLENTDLSNANLRGASLVGAKLTDANIYNIEIDEGTRLSLSKITRSAIEKKRPVLDFALGFPSMYGNEAPIFHLTKILSNLQSLINNIGQSIQLKQTGKIAENIAELTGINASVTFQSSFGIQLVASNSPNILGESIITDSIETFVNLVQASKNVNSLEGVLTDLKHNSAVNYQAFIKELRNSGASLKVEWSSDSDVSRTGSAKLSPSEVEEALDVVKQVASEEVDDFEVVGELVAGNAETRYFLLKDINSDKKYSGYILSEAMKNGETLSLEKIYTATIRAVTKSFLISRQTKVEYKLVRFSQTSNSAPAENEAEKIKQSEAQLFGV